MHRSLTWLALLSHLIGCGSTNDATALPKDQSQEAKEPSAEFVPLGSGACPELADGYVTFSPSGIEPRRVRLWLDPAAANPGPLVFYWHGMGSKPEEATYGLGSGTVASILEKGGVVAAPEHDPAAGQFPWFLTTGAGREDDLLLADEVLACIAEGRGLDMRRIHSVGMSAGGLQTTQFSYRRSGYLASVVTYSGGKIGVPDDQDPSNPLSAMIFHGGAKDIVILKFMDTSLAFHDDLGAAGRFSFVCDHGLGHKIPLDARGAVGQFLFDHPFGTAPSPYVGGLPEGFPSYCMLD